MPGILNLILGGVGVVKDAYFNLVSLLLPGNGTNGAQNNTFLDSSTNNFTITRNGNTTQGTFSPFSQTGWGNYFDGSNDSLTVSSNAAFGFGTGDFCVEFWMYPTALTTARGIYLTNATGGLYIYTDTSNKLIVRASAVATLITSNDAISLNTWTHVAVCRTGTTLSLYLNGSRTAGGTASNSTNFAAGDLYIGAEINTFYYSGYLGSLRAVKGSAVYDPTATTITVPTAPLSAVSGTSLLTCQYNRFRDASSNGFTVTPNNGVAITPFSPFAPTAAYTTAAVGGSGYFDGSGDYLTVADNASLELGSSNFTLETWVYVTAAPSGLTGIFAKGGSPYGGFYLGYNASRVVKLYASTTSSTWDIANDVGAQTLSLNAWNHVAISRNGSSWRIWVNGTSGSSDTVTSSSAVWNTANAWYIGSNPTGAENFTGYMASARFVIGSYVYDPASTTLTIPTAPLTNITNTSLLLNYTNAGIYDATSKNDLETVGNAQISTSVSKFGGGSIYLDGTGDWLAAPATPLSELGSGDFTIEAWLYRTASGATFDSGIVSRGAPTTLNGYVFGYNVSNILFFNINYSGATNITGSTAISANTWTHVAVTRSGNTFRLFLNGTVDATATISASPTTNAGDIFYVGRSSYDSSRIVTGYLDDVRITRGLARYTANFTPPTAAFPIL